MNLDGRRALIMGGSSGIGEATATRLAAAGTEVLITGRNEDKLADAAGRIGGKVAYRRVDASSDEEVAEFFADPAEFDWLVLALSGSRGGGPLTELGLGELRAGFEAKFWAHLRVLQAALPRLRPYGSVTFVTAASARAALPGTAGLAAINGALEAMVRPLATELAPLRVNAVSPGVVDTPWWDHLPSEQRETLFQAIGATSAVGRVGQPDDLAPAIVLAATNGFMTGTIIEVTGGVTLATGR